MTAPAADRAGSAARYIAEQLEIRRFERYIRRVGKIMPALAARVFALRGQLYMGCGFHWGMERSLGRLIASVNDYENVDLWHGKKGIATRVIVQVCACALFEEVAAAERSLDPTSKRTRDLRATKRRLHLDAHPSAPDRHGDAPRGETDGGGA